MENSESETKVSGSSFDQKLAAKIREENITPYPRWRFLLKDYVVVAAGTLSLLIGAGAVAVMIYLFRDNDWDLRPEIQPNLWKFLLLTLPYFWIIFLVIFIGILYYNFRHMRRGYRYPAGVIAAGAVLASVLLGGVFYASGFGEKIDDVLGAQAPFYHKIMNRHVMLWQRPQEGFLTGRVIQRNPDGSFEITDFEGRRWQIFPGSELMPLNPDFLREGRPVNMMGRVAGDSQFRVEMIRPTGAGRAFIIRHSR